MKIESGMNTAERKPAHACGHNLITSASIAGFIACWEALKLSNSSGCVRLLGTPAEEKGGGKLDLLKAGAYIDVDACIMAHPGPLVPDETMRSCAITSSLASKRMVADFQGVPAHAGLAPWEGRNALDALINSYVSIATLRQQLLPSQRINGIITNGGKATNIIPDQARAEFGVRAENRKDLEVLCQKMIHCFEAGAMTTGCSVQVDNGRAAYWDLISNDVLCKEYTQQMNKYNSKTVYSYPGISDNPGPATDQGNVSHFLPAIEAAFFIDSKGAVNHTPKFADAAGTEDAFDRALEVGKGLAGLAFEVITNETFRKEVKESFERDVLRKAESHARKHGLSSSFTKTDIESLLSASMRDLAPLYREGKISHEQAIGALIAIDSNFESP
ncbi:hypothetical protein AA313_de0202398 [Arthrobotrys entomopaga]|nr:hypothetical protein AA313_de0202398 [Arthrobotrys entomopaga]